MAGGKRHVFRLFGFLILRHLVLRENIAGVGKIFKRLKIFSDFFFQVFTDTRAKEDGAHVAFGNIFRQQLKYAVRIFFRPSSIRDK